MYRYKHTIADRLRAKHLEAQKREALIAVDVIRQMAALGMPESAKASCRKADGCIPTEPFNNAPLLSNSW